jgi:diketogulonate reductase-like aldo/keto reductase
MKGAGMTTRTSPLLTLNNGVQIPAVGLGVFQSPPEQTAGAVESALTQGYRLVDTAAAYFNEMQVGEGLQRSGVAREEVFLETKVDLHPYFQQTALQRLHAEHRILTQAWSPIGGLTSYYRGGKSAFDDPALPAIACQHGKSPAQVMLRWHLQEGRSAIPKSTKPSRIAENFDVFDFELSKDQLAAIDALDTGVRRGPEPDSITLETYGREIPEA